MKEIKEREMLYLEEYDIKVKPYLTYSEIFTINESVLRADTWAEKKTTADIFILYFATDMKGEDIDEIGHAKLLQSGLIDAVKSKIVNIHEVQACVKYTTSIERSLSQILKILNAQFSEEVQNESKE